MKFRPKAALQVVTGAAKEFSEDKAPRLGAALAYYTIFSIAPLLVITIAIVGVVFHKEAAQGMIDDQLAHLIGKQGGEAIQSMIKGAGDKKNTGIVASIIGFVVLLFGASGVFIQLKDALNTIWNVEPEKQAGGVMGFIKTRFLSFGLVLAVGFLLLVSLVISTVLSGVGKFLGGIAFLTPVLGILNFAISFGVITGLFAMLFKWLPDVKLRWKDVLLGAAITSFLFTIGKSLIGMYLGKSSVTSAYGAAGSLVVLLIWIYYSAQILFFGAELTQVYTRRYGSLFDPETPEERQKLEKEAAERKKVASAAEAKSSDRANDADARNDARQKTSKNAGSSDSNVTDDNRAANTKLAPAPMPAFATKPNPVVEKAAQGLTYGILALVGLGTAKRAVGLAPLPEDPIHLGGTGKPREVRTATIET
jgi:membrane protein